MYECEICGKTSARMFVVAVEGAQMTACQECAKGKRIILHLGEETGSRSRAKTETSDKEPEIVEGYGELIRKARESMQLPVGVLAEKISEKESTLIRVEKQKSLPTIKLALKLQKELGIKLFAGGEEPTVQPRDKRKNEDITIWDAAEKKGKLKEEDE